MSLVELSKHSEGACVKTVAYARIEVGLNIFVSRAAVDVRPEERLPVVGLGPGEVEAPAVRRARAAGGAVEGADAAALAEVHGARRDVEHDRRLRELANEVAHLHAEGDAAVHGVLVVRGAVQLRPRAPEHLRGGGAGGRSAARTRRARAAGRGRGRRARSHVTKSSRCAPLSKVHLHASPPAATSTTRASAASRVAAEICGGRGRSRGAARGAAAPGPRVGDGRPLLLAPVAAAHDEREALGALLEGQHAPRRREPVGRGRRRFEGRALRPGVGLAQRRAARRTVTASRRAGSSADASMVMRQAQDGTGQLRPGIGGQKRRSS